MRDGARSAESSAARQQWFRSSRSHRAGATEVSVCSYAGPDKVRPTGRYYAGRAGSRLRARHDERGFVFLFLDLSIRVRVGVEAEQPDRIRPVPRVAARRGGAEFDRRTGTRRLLGGEPDRCLPRPDALHATWTAGIGDDGVKG